MKIFITALSDLSLSKGNVTHILEVVGQLTRMGHDITLFVPKYGLHKGKLPFRVVYVPLVQIPVRGLRFFSGLVSFQITLFFCLFRLCIKQKPDAIYSRHDVFIMAPSVFAGILRVPLFSEVNGVFSDELSFRGHGIVGIWINDLIETFAYKCSKRIFVVTAGIKEHLTNLLDIERERISVIPNGADIELVKPQALGPAKQMLGISSTSYVIGYLGNFEYYQGIEYLVRGLPDVLKKYPGVCCLLVGDGSLKSSIELLAKEHGVFDSCVFTGAVPHSDVGTYLAAMDICVTTKVPIKSGYSPLKLYEYLSAGRAVVATDTSGFELIEKYCCGVLVKPKDPISITEGILELLDNPEKRLKMGKNARLYMEEFGSWEKVISKVEDLIKKEVAS